MKFTRITVRPLEAADIDEALRYAASLAEDETIELVV